jgi:hypothetical protein
MKPDFTFTRLGNKRESTVVMKSWGKPCAIPTKKIFLAVSGPQEERNFLADKWSTDDTNPDFETIKALYIKQLEHDLAAKIRRIRKVTAVLS